RHVLRAGSLEDVGPVIGIVELALEHGREIEVREVGTIHAIVKLPRGRAWALVERIPIPLGVHGLALGVDRGVSGHAIDAPMYEDPEFAVGVPHGRGPAVDRIPSRL